MQVLAYDYTSVLGMSIGMMTATDTLQFTAISPQKLYSVARQVISTCHHELCHMAVMWSNVFVHKKLTISPPPPAHTPPGVPKSPRAAP